MADHRKYWERDHFSEENTHIHYAWESKVTNSRIVVKDAPKNVREGNDGGEPAKYEVQKLNPDESVTLENNKERAKSIAIDWMSENLNQEEAKVLKEVYEGNTYQIAGKDDPEKTFTVTEIGVSEFGHMADEGEIYSTIEYHDGYVCHPSIDVLERQIENSEKKQ